VYYVKLLIGNKDNGKSCFKVLPEEINDTDSGVRSEVIQCACLSEGEGYSMIRITDPDGVLSDKIEDKMHTVNENGEYTINRISSNQMIAMVRNYNCELAKVVSESGCFITSAIAETEDMVCWTIVGPNSTHVNDLISRLDKEGFPIERKSSFHTDHTTLLSEKQEEALRVAFENGFYEIPRKIKMKDLCEYLNCSKSTLDVTLRTAERKIINHFVLENRDSIIRKKK